MKNRSNTILELSGGVNHPVKLLLDFHLVAFGLSLGDWRITTSKGKGPKRVSRTSCRIWGTNIDVFGHSLVEI